MKKTRTFYSYRPMNLLCLVVAIFSSLFLHADPAQKLGLFIGHPPYNPGMFSVFSSVAGFLFEYDTNPGLYSGVTINFGNQGLYYDPQEGDNWWEYYFEPLKLGKLDSATPVRHLESNNYADYAFLTELHLSRNQVFDIVNRYMKIKPHILNEIQEFVDEKFKDHFIIGVHYRGTDKSIEAPRVAYEHVVQMIINLVRLFQLYDFRIFVATDEKKFLDYMQGNFPGHVISQNIFRSTSGQPTHLVNADSPYKRGKDALTDCLLLSNSHVLIRTSSNLSLWTSYFNPDLPVIALSNRY